MTLRTTKGPNGLLLIMQDVDEPFEPELNAWWDEEHIPERLAMPGFVSARRFLQVEGYGPKYMTFYELESPDAVHTDIYENRQPTPRSLEKRKHRVDETYKRNVYLELHP